MTTIWSFVGAAASIQGILLSMVLLAFPVVRKWEKIYFASLILTFSLWLAEFSLYWSTYLLRYPQFSFTTHSLPWLFGPFLFLLVSKHIFPDGKLNIKPILHFLPFTIHFIYYLPKFFGDSEGKLNQLEAYIYTETPDFSSLFFILNILLFIHIISYSLIVLIKARRIQSDIGLLPVALSIGLIMYSFQKLIHLLSIFFIGYKFIFTIGAFLVVSSCILLYALSYISIINPSFLAIKNLEKYKNTRISKEKSFSIKRKLEEYFLIQKKYQISSLSLLQISSDLDIPKHYISQVVNTEFGLNVNDMINKFRVEEIKEKLIDPQYQHYRILAIALDAGFANKASFYNAFRKHTGSTPSDYLEKRKSKTVISQIHKMH